MASIQERVIMARVLYTKLRLKKLQNLADFVWSFVINSKTQYLTVIDSASQCPCNYMILHNRSHVTAATQLGC